MIPKNLFQKVRRIQITTSRLVNDVFAGQYHSVFKGRGMEFDEVREYQFGDDIRTIDWNVTARTGKAHIKKFVEERELTVMILVDASRSCRFATVNELKSKLAAELAAVLAFSAIRNNDKVGLIIFTDTIEKFIAARKGVTNVLRVIREVLYFKPHKTGTDIIGALEYLNKVTTRKTVSFLISDFYHSEGPAENKDKAHYDERLRKTLSIANKRHDLVAITLNDRREVQLDNAGILELEDAETGRRVMVDSTSKSVRDAYTALAHKRINDRQQMFRTTAVDHVDIWTDKPYTDELVKFFMKRKKMKSHL